MAISAVDLSKHLKGVDLPASKQDLIDYANSQNVSQELKDILSQMPEREYQNMADVEKAFGEVK
ncbi:DUF2795 domain-containing protein [Gloeothece verrucosa]|uniref:DUF2795 domain-containing protein n=1 Tax=Gloeothece verrucosa (strain PCC 7822) TaxID=497965 RepID=E0ULV7_GLOV7|nr:DUF2795 domain-containing protein [Gloeothece verrucosa]ADN17937.1 conserved hypothetical protein [Gloeothece verrucosa PCC 7822]